MHSLGGGSDDGDGSSESGLEVVSGREERRSIVRRQPSATRMPAATYGPLVSAMLLSLLPLPAAAYPRAEPGAMRRDRRRSRGADERAMNRATMERLSEDKGWEKKRRMDRTERGIHALASVQAQNSQVRYIVSAKRTIVSLCLVATPRSNADDVSQTSRNYRTVCPNDFLPDRGARYGVALQIDQGRRWRMDDC